MVALSDMVAAMSERWFTNTRFASVDRKSWEVFSVGSKVVTGPPRPNIHHTVAELTKMKMVGLYETRPGVPPLPDPQNPTNDGERSAFAGLLP